jgi:hypothetical protein
MKRADAPQLTPSMRMAIEDFRLEQLVVLGPGETEYELADKGESRRFRRYPWGIRPSSLAPDFVHAGNEWVFESPLVF